MGMFDFLNKKRDYLVDVPAHVEEDPTVTPPLEMDNYDPYAEKVKVNREMLDNKLSNIVGWNSFKNFCYELGKAAAYVNGQEAKAAFLNQNLLISGEDGCGFTYVMSYFVDIIRELGFFPDIQSTFYEVRIVPDSSEDFKCYTPWEFLCDLEVKERKNSLYVLDIREYLEKGLRDDLKKLLRYMTAFEKEYVFVFRVPFMEPSALVEFEDFITDVLYTRTISVAPFTEEETRQLATRYLSKMTYFVSEDAWDIFLSRIREEKNDGRFYGAKTVNNIACEMVWLAELAGQTNNINREDIMELSPSFDKHEKSGFDELNELIGMEEILERIHEIVTQIKVAKENGSDERPCLHMRFTGAPGTGKTTVARIIGKIFRENGILRNGYFFEHAGRDLCAEYVGQTAPKTAGICRDAYGSVLFLDEAYALYEGKNESNDFGREAIATLIAEMENHRDDMVVIMAGYTEDMDKLMEINSGLRSRMPYKIEFKSYTKEQLAQIFMLTARKHFVCDDDLEPAVKEYFMNLDDNYVKSEEFANARFARNLYERTWSKAAMRCSLTGSGKIVLKKEDLVAASTEKEFSENLVTEKRIGF